MSAGVGKFAKRSASQRATHLESSGAAGARTILIRDARFVRIRFHPLSLPAPVRFGSVAVRAAQRAWDPEPDDSTVVPSSSEPHRLAPRLRTEKTSTTCQFRESPASALRIAQRLRRCGFMPGLRRWHRLERARSAIGEDHLRYSVVFIPAFSVIDQILLLFEKSDIPYRRLIGRKTGRPASQRRNKTQSPALHGNDAGFSVPCARVEQLFSDIRPETKSLTNGFRRMKRSSSLCGNIR